MVRRFVEEVQGRHRSGLLEEPAPPAYMDHVHLVGSRPMEEAREPREALRRPWSGRFLAFPELEGRIDDQIAEGDRVVSRKAFRGTHLDPFGGQPPTGRWDEFEVADIFRLSEGKIGEHGSPLDILGLAQRLGPELPG